jgi:anti-sigma factor RsiW
VDLARVAGGEHDEMTCRELVELVTEYLEGKLPEHERELLEAHLAGCSHCVEYLAQMRRTIDMFAELAAVAIDPARERELLAAFRGGRNA